MSYQETHEDLRRESLRAEMQALMQENPDADTIDLMVAAHQAGAAKCAQRIAHLTAVLEMVKRAYESGNSMDMPSPRTIDDALMKGDE